MRTPPRKPDVAEARGSRAVKDGSALRGKEAAAGRATHLATDRSARPATSHATKMLCVDDHAVLVEGLKAQFAIEGRIEVVGRLGTAAKLVEEARRLQPDAVLLDIEMPGPDAFEMADRLHRLQPKVRIIVLSAHIRDAFISASFASGASAYFAKSDELEDIVGGIHEVMNSKPGSFLLGPKVRERCRPAASEGASGPRVEDTVASGPLTLLSSLSSREISILRLVGLGLSRIQIAKQLCRSAKTIDAHQSRMMRKLGIAARADLMRFAIREGLAQA